MCGEPASIYPGIGRCPHLAGRCEPTGLWETRFPELGAGLRKAIEVAANGSQPTSDVFNHPRQALPLPASAKHRHLHRPQVVALERLPHLQRHAASPDYASASFSFIDRGLSFVQLSPDLC